MFVNALLAAVLTETAVEQGKTGRAPALMNMGSSCQTLLIGQEGKTTLYGSGPPSRS
jgi:hypothetical protein